VNLRALRDRAASSYQQRPALTLLSLFVLVSLLTRGFLLSVDILDVDEAMHIVGSWQLLRGQLPYVGFIDNKPPLLYVYYAAAQLLLGRGMLAVHLVTVLITVPLTALGVSAFYQHDRRGAIAGLTILVFGAAYIAHDMHAANCEILMLLPATWALVALRDEERAARARWSCVAGALLGLAVLFKQQGAAWLPAFAVALLIAPAPGRRLSVLVRLGALGLGFAAPLVLTWAFFAARGQGPALLFWTVVYNFGYAQQPMERSEILLRIVKYLLPFIVGTLGLWILAPRSWGLLSRYRRTLLAAVLVACLPIVFIGFRFYPHYFVSVYPVLALAVAPALDQLLRRPLSRGARRFRAYTLAVLVGFSIGNGIMYLPGIEFAPEEHKKIYRRVADRLRADACFAGSSMFTWGPEAMFMYPLDVIPASRFVGPYTTISGYVAGNWAVRAGRLKATDLIRDEQWDQLMGDLERAHATYFIDAAKGFRNWKAFPLENFPRMLAFVRAHYDVLGDDGTVRIYRWRGCPTS
jgi:Dolichyl-phosphate-mannose-protein mannosyltransferase